MEFHQIFIVGFILLSVIIYVDSKNNEVEYVISTFDNNRYLVRKMPDAQEAANLLSKIRHNLTKLVQYLQQKCDSKEKCGNYTEGVKRLLYKFNPNNIVETGKSSKYTSYSINKGEKVVLCLRSRDGKEELIDKNTLMFVSLHELAHIMTKSIGHTDEFWNNFKYLLKDAIKMNIYVGVDYNRNPKKYCGITVSDTPLNGI